MAMGLDYDASNIGCQISYIFIVGRYVRVWGLKRPQKHIFHFPPVEVENVQVQHNLFTIDTHHL